MELVASAAGDDVELASAADAEFGAVVAADGAELGHRLHVRSHRHAPVSARVDVVAAIEQPGVVRRADAVDCLLLARPRIGIPAGYAGHDHREGHHLTPR